MSTKLSDIIRDYICRNGPMTVGRYMEICLSHPEHGYYMTRDPFGVAGDFTTAPEISQLFGEMIGAWLADLWIKMGSPTQLSLVECGPGRGTLMADIMRATKNVSGFHDAAKIYLMEMSPALKDIQKQKLEAYDTRWIDDLGQLPALIPVLLVANEFLDALPVRQLMRVNGSWKERGVSIGGDNRLVFVEMEAEPALLNTIPRRIARGCEEGVFETSLVLNQYIKSV
ncbi:MAG TPA: SAM-dependent methyltransferase, partial [Micavibrio sp.]|nr:SAM-dependent methyltransferase [Micavibrio sp.]